MVRQRGAVRVAAAIAALAVAAAAAGAWALASGIAAAASTRRAVNAEDARAAVPQPMRRTSKPKGRGRLAAAGLDMDPAAWASILLALAAPLLDRPWPRAVGAQLAKISYAVFLVHHVLIQELVAHFDLAVLSRRDTAFLFVVYLAATFAAAHALLWLQRMLRTGLAALCPQI